MAAAYEVTIDMTDDETFTFSVEPRTTAGAPPIWAEVSFEYSLQGCGVSLTLAEGDGIEIDEDTDRILIGPADPDYRLHKGQYRHGFRMTDIASGVVTQLFDGTVTVTEGNF